MRLTEIRRHNWKPKTPYVIMDFMPISYNDRKEHNVWRSSSRRKIQTIFREHNIKIKQKDIYIHNCDTAGELFQDGKESADTILKWALYQMENKKRYTYTPYDCITISATDGAATKEFSEYMDLDKQLSQARERYFNDDSWPRTDPKFVASHPKIRCKNCHSSISTEYMTGPTCPVCYKQDLRPRKLQNAAMLNQKTFDRLQDEFDNICKIHSKALKRSAKENGLITRILIPLEPLPKIEKE